MNTAQILIGDALTMLRTLPDASVRSCVTSPPYFGLRDYGTATWVGGDEGCDHIEMPIGMSGKNTLGSNGHLPPTNAANVGRVKQYRHQCPKCGAVRVDNQIGLEATPEQYVARLVDVFREVRRVLRPDGTLWLNIGDSYARTGGTDRQPSTTAIVGSTLNTLAQMQNRDQDVPPGLKPKDLIGIPWRLAFALQADGWWLRSDIIWHKPNPMPESVTDRPTKAHEYLFLLTKAERYYYDAQAIAEDSLNAGKLVMNNNGKNGQMGKYGQTREGFLKEEGVLVAATRNRRSVWTVATEPTPYAHFATMPTALVEPCILAGCPVGGTVLDPFAGSGTTLRVAVNLGRNALGIELNPEYAALAERLLAQTQPALLPL